MPSSQLAAITLALILAASQAQAQLSNLQPTVAQLERSLVHGRVGVAVQDLATGETFMSRGNQRFPMQSVFKLPLGIAVLKLADQGKLDLNQTITIRREDLSIWYSEINDSFKGPTNYTVAELLTLAVAHSDNTAADLLMKRVGGPKRVDAILAKIGVRGIRIDRYERQLQPDCTGLGSFRPELTSEAGVEAAIARLSHARTRAAMARYLHDPRDTSTPRGMLRLIRDLDEGRLLSPPSTRRLIDIMVSSTPGAKRLKAGLPSGTILAHKTGTGYALNGIAGAINDAAIATLPNGRKLAIVVFLAGSSGTSDSRDKLIADVARAVVAATETTLERAGNSPRR
jgi:beta-lactamase class A